MQKFIAIYEWTIRWTILKFWKTDMKNGIVHKLHIKEISSTRGQGSIWISLTDWEEKRWEGKKLFGSREVLSSLVSIMSCTWKYLWKDISLEQHYILLIMILFFPSIFLSTFSVSYRLSNLLFSMSLKPYFFPLWWILLSMQIFIFRRN